MINYIFEIIAFCASIVMYCKDDIKAMTIWFAATVMFGFAGALVDIFIVKRRSHKEVKNG